MKRNIKKSFGSFEKSQAIKRSVSLLTLAGILWALPLLVSQLASQSGVAVSGWHLTNATVEAQQKKRKKTRRVPAMREATYKKITEAHVMIDPESLPREEGEPPPEPTGTPEEAIELLMELMERKGVNSYERAQIWSTLAFAYYTLDDMDAAINAYEQILRETITEPLELTALRALFQLYFAEEQYHKALDYIDRWTEVNGEPDPSVVYFKASIYYQLDDLEESMRQALLVEEICNAQGRQMRENWWYLQVVLYNEFQQDDDVIRVLETLLAHYPKKQYWMNVGGAYSEKGWEDRALSAYYAVYVQGFMDKESELVSLSQRLLSHDESPNPYEAAQVLEEGLESGIVEENEKNMRLLATAYTLAQEHSDAINAWRDSAKYAEDGDIDYRLAQALANEDRHKEAVESYRDAIKKGDLRKESDVYFWLAISQMQLEDWEGAKDSFRAVARLDEDMEDLTRKYIKSISREQTRLEKIKAMLES